MCHRIFSAALFCLFTVFAHAAADPQGSWDVSARSPRGQFMGFITFNADNTYSGYCIQTGTRELTTFQGTWQPDQDGKSITGTYSDLTSGVSMSGTFRAVVRPERSIRGKLFYDDAENGTASFTCLPLQSPPDLSGNYQLKGAVDKQKMDESSSLSRNPAFENVFDFPTRVAGSGSREPVTRRGSALASSRNDVLIILEFDDTTFASRNVVLLGKLSRKGITLRGERGVRASVKLIRISP